MAMWRRVGVEDEQFRMCFAAPLGRSSFMLWNFDVNTRSTNGLSRVDPLTGSSLTTAAVSSCSLWVRVSNQVSNSETVSIGLIPPDYKAD